MISEVIPVPFKTLKKVLHVADLHIRLFKRHKEYREALDTLFDRWSKQDLTDTAIVVAGDIVHSKTDLSPEMVDLATYFLRRCADLAPTLVIAGNHDMNLANTNRLDALSPICDSIQNPNLHYLKYSGIYRVADIDFTVWSLLGDKADWPTYTDSSTATKIALFHGPVDKATTDVGYVVSNRSMEVNVFDGFDMVLLGDIHRQQVLQEFKDNGTAAHVLPLVVYPGSLIQQNHGEAPKGHGWAEWDVQQMRVKFHELPNRFGYYTLKIEKGKIPDYSDMPKNVRLRIFAGSLEQSDIKKLVATIRKKHTIEELAVTNFEGIRRTDSTTGTGNAFLDVHDVQFQNKLIAKYLNDALPGLSQDTLEKVYDLNKSVNDEIVKDDARNVIWKPLHLKFDNLFTYAEGNEIDFTTLNGVEGIFAPNASGKTSVAEAICFALYDRTPRTTKAVSIMNYGKDSCFIEFKFSIGDKVYVINRTGKKNKKGEVKIDVDFYKLEADGSTVSLNGEQRIYTNKNIRDYVGDYEDFILTTFSSSAQTGLFVDRGQSDRKDLLSQFMGLNIFDKLHTYANEESKDIAAALKRFKSDDFTQALVEADDKVAALTEDIRLLEIDLEDVNGQLNDYTTQIQNLYGEKTPLTLKSTNIGQLESTRNGIEAEIYTKKGALVEANASLKKTTDLLERAKTKLVTEYATFDSEYSTFQIRRAHISEFHVKYQLSGEGMDRAMVELARLKEHKYDPNCEFCLLNGDKTIKKIAELEAERDRYLPIRALQAEQLKQYDADMAVEVPHWEERATKFKAGKEFIRTKEREVLEWTQKVSRLESDLAQLDNKLTSVTRSIEDYNAAVDAISQNAEIDGKIRLLESQKQVHKNQFTVTQQAIKGKHGECVMWEQKKRDMLARITEAEELEAKYEVYEAYLAAVCRDGLPYKMIAEVLPDLQTAVNNILNQMTDFSLVFDMDGKNVNMRLAYDDVRVWPLELASGMEKFISGLAIRVALTSLSSLPKSNFLIVDEGLGALDGDNLSSITGLFDVLRTHFDFIFLISHVDIVRDVSDRLLEIKRANGFSQIVVK